MNQEQKTPTLPLRAVPMVQGLGLDAECPDPTSHSPGGRGSALIPGTEPCSSWKGKQRSPCLTAEELKQRWPWAHCWFLNGSWSWVLWKKETTHSGPSPWLMMHLLLGRANHLWEPTVAVQPWPTTCLRKIKTRLTSVKANHTNNSLCLYFFSHRCWKWCRTSYNMGLGPFFPPGFSSMFIKRQNSSPWDFNF